MTEYKNRPMSASERSQILSFLEGVARGALPGPVGQSAEDFLAWLFGDDPSEQEPETPPVGPGILGTINQIAHTAFGDPGRHAADWAGFTLGGDPSVRVSRAEMEKAKTGPNRVTRAFANLPGHLPGWSPETLDRFPEEIQDLEWKAGIVPLTPADIAQLGVLGRYVQRGTKKVYHGTREAFEHFAPKKGAGAGADLMGPGTYLSDSPRIAGHYYETLSAGTANKADFKAAEEVFRKKTGRYPARIGRKPSQETISQAASDATEIRRIALGFAQGRGAAAGAVRTQRLPRGRVEVGEHDKLEWSLGTDIGNRLEGLVTESVFFSSKGKVSDAWTFAKISGSKTIGKMRESLRKAYTKHGMNPAAADKALHGALQDVGIDVISYPSGQVSGIDQGHTNYVVLNQDILNKPRKHLKTLDTRKLFPDKASANSVLGRSSSGDVAEIGGGTYDVYHGTTRPGIAEDPAKHIVLGGEASPLGARSDVSLHAGTLQSSLDRLGQRTSMIGVDSNTAVIPIRMRFKRTLGTRENPLSDGRANALLSDQVAMGELLDRGFDGLVYRNKVEDPGSISVAILGNKERMYARKSMRSDAARFPRHTDAEIGLSAVPTDEVLAGKIDPVEQSLDLLQNVVYNKTGGFGNAKVNEAWSNVVDLLGMKKAQKLDKAFQNWTNSIGLPKETEDLLGTIQNFATPEGAQIISKNQAQGILDKALNKKPPTVSSIHKKMQWEAAFDKMDVLGYQMEGLSPGVVDGMLNNLLEPLGVPVKDQMKLYKAYDAWTGDPNAAKYLAKKMQKYGLSPADLDELLYTGAGTEQKFTAGDGTFGGKVKNLIGGNLKMHKAQVKSSFSQMESLTQDINKLEDAGKMNMSKYGKLTDEALDNSLAPLGITANIDQQEFYGAFLEGDIDTLAQLVSDTGVYSLKVSHKWLKEFL